MSKRQIEILLDRIRKDSGAQLVLIVMPYWGYVSADAGLSPGEVAQLMRDEAPRVQQYLADRRER